MPQVASEAVVQSRSLPPSRASSPRPAQGSGGNSPFASLIEDSPAPPPPPARDMEPATQKTARQDAIQPPAKPPADSKPPKPAQEARTETDRPAEKDAAARDEAKPETKAGEQAPEAVVPDTGDEAASANRARVNPDLALLPAEGQETGQSDKADKDETTGTDDATRTADVSVNNATPAVPDPAAGQVATREATANAQSQTATTTGTVVAATAQAAVTPDQGQTDGDGDAATPNANAKVVLSAPSGAADSSGAAARLAVKPEQAAPGAQQAQAPDTEEPATPNARVDRAPQPELADDQLAAEQKSIAAARGEQPAAVQRAALPDTSGNGPANTQNTPAPSSANAAQNLNVTAAASQPAAPPAANAAAPPAPQAPPPAPVPLAGVPVAITAHARAGKNDFSIRLDPPDLGRVDVRLSVDKEGHITSHLVADRKDTLALLQRDAAGLQRALQDAGFKTADNGLQFSLRDSGQQQQQQQQQSSGGNAGHIMLDDEMPAGDAVANGYGRYLGRVGGVDIRV